MLITVAMAKFFAARRRSWKSLMPMASPMPMIGPIRGEISMAPMMTAVELTLSPSDAMKMAKISTQRLAPLKLTPLVICATISFSSSMSCITVKCAFILLNITYSSIIYSFGLSATKLRYIAERCKKRR